MTLTTATAAGLPADSTVFPVSALHLSVSPEPHPYYLAERDRIAAHWVLESQANPALWDGTMMMHSVLQLQEGVVRGLSHVTPFSTFLYWRKHGRAGALHLFGMPVVLSCDNALIAVKMSAHTANPGKVYCAAGSLDENDMVGDRLDLDANMAREVKEETGLDLGQARTDGGYFGTFIDNTLCIFRLYRFDQTAESLMQSIRLHMVNDHEQEIEGPVAIRSADPKAHAYTASMLPILDFVFGSVTS